MKNILQKKPMRTEVASSLLEPAKTSTIANTKNISNLLNNIQSPTRQTHKQPIGKPGKNLVTLTPYSMNRLFSELFRNFGGVF